MAINRIQYIALKVRDLEESVDWYCRVLGFKELHRLSKPGQLAVAVSLPEAGISLGLIQFTEETLKPFHSLNAGLDHLAFAVSSREELSD
ncbi:MAG: VOC family protein [Actinomycetota bacterium]